MLYHTIFMSSFSLVVHYGAGVIRPLSDVRSSFARSLNGALIRSMRADRRSMS
jgi:hypothetical protein